MKVWITDIEWDTDGEDVVELPTETIIETDSLDVEVIGDILSDTFGFCHFGFKIEDGSVE